MNTLTESAWATSTQKESAHHGVLTTDEHGGLDLLALDRLVRAALDLEGGAPLARELLGGGLSQITIRYRLPADASRATVIGGVPLLGPHSRSRWPRSAELIGSRD